MSSPAPLFRASLVLAALSVAVCDGLTAQGQLALGGTWRYGTLGSEFLNDPQCGGFGAVRSAGSGTISLNTNGTFSYAGSIHYVCANGTNGPVPDSDSGTYTVHDDGRMTVDYDPAHPGTDTQDFALRPDGSAVVFGRDQVSPTAIVGIALQGSSGRGNGALNGTWHVARLVQECGSNTHLESDLGTVQFNGIGGYTEQGMRHVVQANGVSSGAPYNTSGTYTVAADGALTVSGLGAGAIDPRAEVFFVSTAAGARTGLTVGVRRGAAMSFGALAGAWGYSVFHVELGSQVDLPNFATAFGRLDATPTGASSGALDGSGLDVGSTPVGTNGRTVTWTGTAAVAADGAMQILQTGQTTPTTGAVSSDGTFLIGTIVEIGAGQLLIAPHVPRAPVAYGQPTPGTGGVAPRVGQVGLPSLGNTRFALRVADGRGGAPCALVLAAAASPGIPFLGGTLLVDPNTILASVTLPLSGALGAAGAGTATLPLAVPVTPALDRARLHVQALTLDAAAPGLLAMSRGLRIELGR